MNNKDFIAELSRRMGFTQDDTQRVMRTTIDAISGNLQNGDTVLLPNFGTFEVKKRLERVVVNPSTRKRMLVPPKLVLGFKPVAAVKEKLKNGGQANE